jgi:hypothetical protein
VNHKSDNKWKWLTFLIPSSSNYSNITTNVSLIGQDGRPMSVSNVSTRSLGSLSESASASSDSSAVSPAGSSATKPGGETLNISSNGSPAALEIYDSNGGYAGTITITPRNGTETHTNSFLTFALKSDAEPAAGAISATITGETILVDVPFSDITKLTPIFTHDGASVNINVETGLKPVLTGKEPNDFTNNVTYTVIAKNGAKKDYLVKVNKIRYTCELAGMYFTDYPLTGLTQKSDATSTWYEASLPPSANLSALKTSFSVYGTSMKVSGITQVSGVSTNNFASAVTYTVTGSNGCTQDYVVKASLEELKAGKSVLAKGSVVTRGTLDLVDIPEITKVDALGIPKTISIIENKAFGYFDDVKGEYIFTKGQVKLMVPWGSSFDNINLVMETKNNANKVLVDGSDYVRGSTIAKFTQRNGYEKYTVDVILTDKYSAFAVPYEIQIVLGAPPPFLAVSKDANFMLFVNSNAADARDEKKDLEALIKSFAPERYGQIWDLAALIGYINESKIDVARWTIDPGKMELNVIGKGFQNFEMDFDGYNKEYRCYNFKPIYDEYLLQRSLATSDVQKAFIDSSYRGTHQSLCGQTKSYTTFPNFPKTPPSIAGYGGIKPNLESFEGYDVTKSEYDLVANSDIAYFFMNFLGSIVNQDLNSFTVKTKKGVTHTYSLPAPNYMTFYPTTGTVGTEITVSFYSPINPANYTLNLSMDKIPVLNPVYKNDAKGFIIGVTFNVPYISKGSRVICERLPIGGKGEKFIFYSTESLQLQPYKELKGLSYANSTVDYTVEVDAPFYYPILESGKATYYRILSGNLPVGIFFFRPGGVLYGKPRLAQSPAQVVIEAYDGYKRVQTTLTISASLPVAIPAPTLIYSASGYSMLVGKKFTISPVGPKGTNVRYSIDKPMPEGFNFDRETGTISGYPTKIMSEIKYTISASNPTGFAKFNLGLQIIGDKASYTAPILSFSSVNYSLTRKQAATIPPTIYGSAPYEFSATGLPQGVIIDSQTGIISGKPEMLQETGEVLITVQNYAGVASVRLLMSVTDTPSSAPTDLAYTSTTFDFTNGMPISTISPTVTGTLSNCTISPALPAGLSLNSACQISGTPTVDVTNVVYTITGTNASGGAVTTITLTVGSFPPSNLVYAGTPYVINHNQSALITPTYSGGIASCTASPALPTGLAINNSTCAIGGTATVQSSATNYTITATNAFGNTTAVISLAVISVPPSALTYVGSPYSFFQSTASSSGTPTSSGSPITSCTSAPALPAGLTISAMTCTITGSPSSQQGSISYTITATNATGSTTASIQIAVGPQPPNGLLYVGSPFTFYRTQSVGTITPSLTGSPTSCTASPTLPTGLSINNTTCAITGTPTAMQASTVHTITASNASGSNNANVTITVLPVVTQQAYIKAPNAETDDRFGQSVAISGDTLVVGALAEDSNQTTITNGTTASSNNSVTDVGAVYVFKRTGTTWAQEAYLKPAVLWPGYFFSVVSISGDTIAVGAQGDRSSQTTITNGTTAPSDDSGSFIGAVYVYKRTGTTWAQEAYLKAPNPEAQDHFGKVVSISGDTIVAGAEEEDSGQTTITNGTTASSDNGDQNSGAAYVFKRTGTTWAQEAYLKAPNISARNSYYFGGSVSIDGDTIAVGSINERSTQTTITNGTTAPADTSTFCRGAVYVYKRTGTNWAQEAYIKPSANISYTCYSFGVTVSLQGDTLVAGAYDNSSQNFITNGTTAPNDNSMANAGAVYVYKRTGVNWAQEAFVKPSNADANDEFAYASIDGDTMVVGAQKEASNQNTITNGSTASSNNSIFPAGGAAYLFQRTGSIWQQHAYIKPPNTMAGNSWFGNTASISGNTFAIGMNCESSNQTTITNGTTASSNTSASCAGAVYVFTRQ